MNIDLTPLNQDLRLPGMVAFGPGRRLETGKICAPLGTRALLVTGASSLRNSGGLDDILSSLSQEGIRTDVFNGVAGEPTVHVVEEIRRTLQDSGASFVVAAGGGSVIDAAKAAAGLVYEHDPVGDYQWGKEITGRCLPLVALPTTSGAGAEATPNAVITDPGRPAKRSIRHPDMLPWAAIVDPELTYSCPSRVTTHSGLDALVQAVEAHTSRNSGVITRSLSAKAVRLLGENLVRVCSEDPPRDARYAVSAGSLLAGIALANARLGAVHGLAHPLGARFGIPHGLLCGALFPAVARLNEDAVGDIYSEEVAPFILTAGAEEDDGLAVRFGKLLDELGVQVPLALEKLPSSEQEWEALVSECMDSGSFRANPRELSPREVRMVLEEVLVNTADTRGR